MLSSKAQQLLSRLALVEVSVDSPLATPNQIQSALDMVHSIRTETATDYMLAAIPFNEKAIISRYTDMVLIRLHDRVNHRVISDKDEFDAPEMAKNILREV